MSFRKLKIAFLVGRFPSISETFILNQITGLIDAGHEVDIYATNCPLDLKTQPEVEAYGLIARTRYLGAPSSIVERYRNGLPLVMKMLRAGKRAILRAFDVRAYHWKIFSLTRLYLLYPLLERGPYDILHCHFGPLGLAGVQLKEMGVSGKIVVTFHGQDISGYLRTAVPDIYHRMFTEADLLMPISEYFKSRLIELGADEERVQVHRMGINLSQFPYHARNFNGDNEICLLTVSRLVEKKGIPFAIQAVSRVVKRHPHLRIRYSIIGDGEQEEELRRVIAENELQECVHLLGPKDRNEIYEHMANAHIFLLPSITDTRGDQEGIPVSIMEAMATGMPILSTRHTGIPELVEDGVSGYLVPERDVESLADRLEQLIEHPETCAELGRNGRRSVEARYDIRDLNRQLIETYYALVSGVVP